MAENGCYFILQGRPDNHPPLSFFSIAVDMSNIMHTFVCVGECLCRLALSLSVCLWGDECVSSLNYI